MRILKDMIDKAEDTMDEIEWYAEKALALKQDKKQVADAYIKIAEMHITIYDMLHTQMVNLIDEHKRMGNTAPAEMQAIWDYEHEKLVKHFAELKYMVEDYKKSY